MSIQDGFVIPMTADKIVEAKEKVEEVRVANNNLVKKVLTTTANGATTLFNFTGNIRIKAIYGIVTTIMQTKTQNCKLSVKSDALADYDICANKDLSAVDVGTLITITGTAANAAVATTVVGSIAPFQASEIIATSIESGIIKVTAGAANTGAITWFMQWEPLSEGATVTVA
jgi:hypothetical protein